MKKLFVLFALTSVLFSYKNKISAQNLGTPGPNITDVEGNSYKTVSIGKQTWMAENLKTSKYNDGVNIPNITDDTKWGNDTIGGWTYYNNDSSNNVKFGKLYNWYSVSPKMNGNKYVCPIGWHVPTDAEWKLLIDYLGGASLAGAKMKEVGIMKWNTPNINATNSSLFTGVPGGSRNIIGVYDDIGSVGGYWSSTEFDRNSAFYFHLYCNNDLVGRYDEFKVSGISIRCIKD